MKKLLVLLSIVLIFSFSVAAEDVNTEDLKFGYTVMDLTNPYFTTLVNGAKDRAEELGIDITIHDGKSDPMKQITAIENFMAQQVDAIICSPVDQVALEPAVKRAHEAGTPFINPNQKIQGVDANINLIDFQYGFKGGEIAGKWIASNFDKEVEVAILGMPAMKALKERADGIVAGIRYHAPNAKIVARQSGNTPSKGMKAAESILQANPNVQVIVGHNDAGALGAYEAVKAAGKADENFCIVGLDATQQALDLIREGTIYRGTVDIDPYGTGVLVIDTAVKVLEEGPIDNMVNIPMKSVTAENIENYFE